MKIEYIIATLVLLLTACSEPEEVKTDPDEPEVVVVTPDFEGDRFDDPVKLELLEELNICEVNPVDTSLFAVCSPENFEIHPFRSDKELKDAFILQTKSKIQLKGSALPLQERHVIVYEREDGQLVRTNGFLGEIMTIESNDTKVNDIVLAQYLAYDEVLAACRYKWNGERYSFDSVDGIDVDNKGIKPLKPELKDTISADIYNTLVSEKLILD